MSSPSTAWLRRASLALACGMATPALGAAPQPFNPPQHPTRIQSPQTRPTSAGHATVTFLAPGQSSAAAVVPATVNDPLPAQPAQHAIYQTAPGQQQSAVEQTALVQKYDHFVNQLPNEPSQYPLERAAQVIPVSVQGDPAPTPVPATPDVGAEMETAAPDEQPMDVTPRVAGPSPRYPQHGDCDTCGKRGASCGCKTGPSGFFWVRGDYLLWWTKGSPLPPLVTSSPDTTPIAQAGVLGQPGTTILFGDSDVNDDDRSGYRFRAGYWLDCRMCAGIEAEYLQLDTKTTGFDAFCPPGGTLNRPFFNVQTGLQDSELVCYPGIVNGSVHINADSDFQSAGARFVRNICQREWCVPAGDCCEKMIRGGYRLDWLAGYRYLRLDEGLLINEMLVSTNTGGVIPVGTTFEVQDNFQTDSEFHGGDLGLMAQWRRGRWSLDLLGKAAIGNVTNSVTISGSTTTVVPNGPTTTNPGGLFTQATNIGTFQSDDFSIVPEVSLNVGYNVTQRLRALVGYTFIYWTDVVRPGDQIDLGLNPSQFPPGTLVGDARPAFNLNDSDFWAQGLNVGLEYRF